ncbi:hypothetical protein ACFUTV_40635 [Streptomyces sp. NPDC057298]
MHTMTPAAQRSYDTYVEHLRACHECPRGTGRCTAGAELVRVYLAALKKH